MNPTRLFDLYIYDSTNDSTVNYDHVLVVPAPTKNGAQAVANLSQNEWADVKVTLIGARAGQTAGLLLKAIDLAPDLSQFRLYFHLGHQGERDVQRARLAGLGRVRGNARPRLPDLGRCRLLATRGRHRRRGHVRRAGPRVGGRAARVPPLHFETLGVEADLLLLGTPITDEFGHQFTALFTPRDIDNDPNPYYDDVEGDGVRDNRVAIREGYVRSAYEEADETSPWDTS